MAQVSRDDQPDITEYFNLVRRIAGRYSRSGRHDIEDLVQEGMIGVMEALKRYDPEKGNFTAYSSHWARKKILEAIRPQTDTPTSSEITENTPAAEITDANQEQMQHILETYLKGIERKVIFLDYHDGLTLHEIADTLQISRDKAKQLKRRALRRLRNNGISLKRFLKKERV